MSNPFLIFDFDGTLVDSFHAVMEKFNLLAEEYRFRKIENDERDSLKNLTSHELIKYLKIPTYKIPRILRTARKQMQNDMQTLLPCLNLPEVLQELHSRKITLGILTTNSSENVMAWLKKNNMEYLFNFIHAESSYFGKMKLLKKIINLYQIDKSKAFYIGDETRDITAAKECDIYSVAVTWGFNSEKILLQYEPHYIARKPEDILMLCEK